MAIWVASSNQSVFDLAIQLYGNVSFANQICVDNKLDWNYQTKTNDTIYYDTNISSETGTQKILQSKKFVVATGFESAGGVPPYILRAFNNDFSLAFS
jgi:hypothetical protein